MKALLIINALFEGLFGVVALVSPQVVWPGADATSVSLGRGIAIAALAIATLCVAGLRDLRNERVGFVVLATLTFWHIGQATITAIAAAQHIGPPPPAVIHAGFAIACVVMLLRAKPAAAIQPR